MCILNLLIWPNPCAILDLCRSQPDTSKPCVLYLFKKKINHNLSCYSCCFCHFLESICSINVYLTQESIIHSYYNNSGCQQNYSVRLSILSQLFCINHCCHCQIAQLCITKFFINYNNWPKFCFYPDRILKILTIRLDLCSLVFMKIFFTDSQFSFCISVFCFLLLFPCILRVMVRVILWSSNAHDGKGLPLVVSGKSYHYLLSLSW